MFGDVFFERQTLGNVWAYMCTRDASRHIRTAALSMQHMHHCVCDCSDSAPKLAWEGPGREKN